MDWISPPDIGTRVKNSNEETGTINNLVDDYFVIVTFDNGSFECVHINDLCPINNSELPIPTPIDYAKTNEPDQFIDFAFKWNTPFAVNQRVALNPNHNNYETFKNYIGNNLGTIHFISNTTYNHWIIPEIYTRLIDVKWDNGILDSFPVSSLLPVGENIFQPDTRKFEIGTKVSTNGRIGYVIANTDHVAYVTLLKDGLMGVNCHFKKFLDIVDDKPHQLIRYDIENHGYIYHVYDEDLPNLDELIFNQNLKIYNVTYLNEIYC